MKNIEQLIHELCGYSNETEWLEFKHNNFAAETIGKDISALANSACLYDKDKAYMVWGVDDKKHTIIGTDYNRFSKLKESNQEITSWLRNKISSNADFEFINDTVDDKEILLLQK